MMEIVRIFVGVLKKQSKTISVCFILSQCYIIHAIHLILNNTESLNYVNILAIYEYKVFCGIQETDLCGTPRRAPNTPQNVPW